MAGVVSFSAVIDDVLGALDWVMEVKAPKVNLSIDPAGGSAGLWVDSPEWYRECPVGTGFGFGGSHPVVVELAFPSELKQSLMLARNTEGECTFEVTVGRGGGIDSVVLTAGSANKFSLSFQGSVRRKKRPWRKVGSVPAVNLVHAVKAARSINHVVDDAQFHVVFQVRGGEFLDVVTMSSAPVGSVFLRYSMPFVGVDGVSEGDLGRLQEFVAVIPVPRSMGGDSVDVLMGDDCFGFADTVSGAVALYAERTDTNPALVQVVCKSLDAADGLEWGRQVPVQVSKLKDVIQRISSANAKNLPVLLATSEDSRLLVSMGDWVTALNIPAGADNYYPLKAALNCYTSAAFLLPSVGSRTSVINFLPVTEDSEYKDYVCRFDEDGEGRLTVIALCDVQMG